MSDIIALRIFLCIDRALNTVEGLGPISEVEWCQEYGGQRRTARV
jgi:hypothetical protein